MKRILALDLGSRVGFAVDGESGFMDMGSKGDTPGKRFVRFFSWLNSKVYAGYGHPQDGDRLIDKIVYEKPHHRGGASTLVLVGMEAMLLAYAEGQGIETASVHSGTLKKFTTGDGRADKAAMAKALNRKGKDDNETDAIALYNYAMSA